MSGISFSISTLYGIHVMVHVDRLNATYRNNTDSYSILLTSFCANAMCKSENNSNDNDGVVERWILLKLCRQVYN